MHEIKMVSNRMLVVMCGVVVAETGLGKLLFGDCYFPLADTRSEYLSPAPGGFLKDEIGDALLIDAEVAERVDEAVARYYYNPRPCYGVLEGHISFDPRRVTAYYYINGRGEKRKVDFPFLPSTRENAA